MLRTRDRMHELFNKSEAGDKIDAERIRLTAVTNRVEKQAALLLTALHSIYLALAAFSSATLVTLLGTGVAAFHDGIWVHSLAVVGFSLGLEQRAILTKPCCGACFDSFGPRLVPFTSGSVLTRYDPSQQHRRARERGGVCEFAPRLCARKNPFESPRAVPRSPVEPYQARQWFVRSERSGENLRLLGSLGRSSVSGQRRTGPTSASPILDAGTRRRGRSPGSSVEV